MKNVKTKLFLTFIFVLSVNFSLFSQAPPDYYTSAYNTKGDDLKEALYEIIKGHVEFPYTSSSTDVWDILKVTDRDPNNSANVILIYSGRSINAAQEYNNGNGWTREHVWAKSRGDFGTSKGAGTDVHHLRPLSASVNSTRSNRSFDNCMTCQDVVDKGFNTGSKIDAFLWTFQPRDEVKGDVARMIFYMATRYEGFNGEPDLQMTNSTPPQTDKAPYHGVLNTLLVWNEEDPVDAFEMNRNNIIFDDYQLNRNPFIDYPEIADHIWGSKMNENWNPTLSVSVLEEDLGRDIMIYPNPSKEEFSIIGFSQNAKVELYDMTGKLLLKETLNSKEDKIAIGHLEGLFIVKVKYDNDQQKNMKLMIN
ncbi:endonuclease [Aureivirga sp. CE67]|uniref:endonuclease n=1 Tax=Aureivirga sp. CE67 TaxID=1788983 RepID=UPI0018CA3EA7|nr:endonuclease [Aureivirga sp. CE67]